MAKSIGNLAAIVTANTSKFSQGMSKASASVNGLKSSVASASSFISGKFIALGAVIGTALGVNALKNTAKAMDEIAKQADRIGITTEALVGLRHAAELGGSSAEGVGTALENMSKQLGLAAAGNSKAAMGFNLLSLDANKLAQLHPEHAIMAISDALAAVEDPALRAAASSKIFGGEGTDLINVLSQGSEALKASRAEAEALGLTFNRIDAAKVEAANDAFSRLQGVVTGVAQTLVIQLAPYVEAATTALVGMGTSGEGMGPKIIAAIEWITVGIAKLWDIVDLGKIAWQGLQIVGVVALQAMLLPLNKLMEGILWTVKQFESVLPSAVTNAAKEFEAFQKGFNDGLNDQATEAAQKIQDILVGESASDKAARFFAEIKRNADIAAKAIADQAPKAPAVEYGKDILNSVKLAEPGKEIAKQIEDNAKDIKISTAAPKLFLSGTQAAIGARRQVLIETLTDILQEQADIASKSHDELKQIKEVLVTDNADGDDIY